LLGCLRGLCIAGGYDAAPQHPHNIPNTPQSSKTMITKTTKKTKTMNLELTLKFLGAIKGSRTSNPRILYPALNVGLTTRKLTLERELKGLDRSVSSNVIPTRKKMPEASI